MQNIYDQIHERALEISTRFLKAESDLIDVIQEVETHKVFRKLGYTSLFTYATGALKLAENTAYSIILVARKAKEIPALKKEIRAGSLNVSKARRIAPHLTLENQSEWIEIAKELPQKKLEFEIAKRFSKNDTLPMRFDLTEEETELFKRAKDIVSQRTAIAASDKDAFIAVLKEFLDRRDPVKKAERVQKRMQDKRMQLGARQVNGERGMGSNSGVSVTRKREPIPALLTHQLALRDQNQCTHPNPDGTRCSTRRWLHTHHVQHVSHGGQNTLENLTTLCFAHHRMMHGTQGT